MCRIVANRVEPSVYISLIFDICILIFFSVLSLSLFEIKNKITKKKVECIANIRNENDVEFNQEQYDQRPGDQRPTWCIKLWISYEIIKWIKINFKCGWYLHMAM